jgi:Protein of unknown function (DUF3581)
MFIDEFYAEADGKIVFTRQQGSDFAKSLAGDFNPLHDVDGKRFCIPGDLLFSIVLAKYGVSQHMDFIFSGMVTEGVELTLPEPKAEMFIQDAQGKEYLQVKRGGDNSQSEALIQNLTRNYVEFSGLTFPHILQPLMAGQNVMIHPTRPMVMYESMTIDLDTLAVESPTLEADYNQLKVDGKRGAVKFAFNLVENGQVVGRGCKRLVLGGLREYDAAAMDEAVADFNARKAAYQSA